MNQPDQRPLIAGAGPTGLSAALFLAGRGHAARIVEQHKAPTPYAKALAVNPRSLELLFAALANADALDRYDALRRPVDRAVVRRVRLLSSIASGESALFRLMRTYLLPQATRTPAIAARMIATLAGLDHGLPQVPAGGALACP